jgi:hypothetical protein
MRDENNRTCTLPEEQRKFLADLHHVVDRELPLSWVVTRNRYQEENKQ